VVPSLKVRIWLQKRSLFFKKKVSHVSLFYPCERNE